jgi:3-carboxy-cis,cis-muconate cycloisomerase
MPLESAEQGGTLAEALSRNPAVTDRIDAETITRLTSPDYYLGLAPAMVDRVLASRPRP